MTDEDVYFPNEEMEELFLAELELGKRVQLGLLDTVEDAEVAFRTILGENIDGKEDIYIPHS
jgi:hypothetical protein